MNESLQARLEHLEALYSEQEYTVQALNDTVAQQDRELARLTLIVERLKDQLLALKTEVTSDINTDNEKPPHY
ncbi:MAG: SlyX family protein [Gammaproteobacteria bacterium]|nr:SlyX family protein [Gammaproteobacteria bacterium]